MEFPMMECIETSIALVQKIATAIENVKSFKERSNRLQKRIQSLIAPTQALYEKDKNILLKQPPVYQHALYELKKCLVDIEIFMLKIASTGKIKLHLKSEDFKTEFEELNTRLTDLSSDLKLGVAVQGVVPSTGKTFDKKRTTFEDRRDEAKDIADTLKYIKEVQKKLNFDDMSDENKLQLKGMFLYLQCRGARLQELYRQMEEEEGDMADADDDLEDIAEVLDGVDLQAGQQGAGDHGPLGLVQGADDVDDLVNGLKVLAQEQKNDELETMLKDA